MSDVSDLINAVIEKNPVEFDSIFNDLMHQRAMEALETRKLEVAQSIYGGEDATDEAVITDFDDIDEELEGELDGEDT